MNWFLWYLVVVYVLGAAFSVSQVGKPRKPLEAGAAGFAVIYSALVIAGIFVFGAN